MLLPVQMLTQPSPSPHSHPVRQHPCFPHWPARSPSSTRGPMWERRGEPHKAGSPLPTQWPGLRHQSLPGSAPPAVCLPDVLHGENVQTPDPRVAKPHLCENSCVTDTPPVPNQEPAACVPVWWLAGLAPLSGSGLLLCLQGREMSSYSRCTLVMCHVPPCSGCEPQDEREHPGSHMCMPPQSMKNLLSDVSVVPGHKASYSVQCVI